MKLRAIFVPVVLVTLAGVLTAADPAKEGPKDKRETLSTHETVAKLTGVAFQKCRGLTSLCPDKCGHSGDFATFEIVGYISYTKPGEYGDPKAASYSFQLKDNMNNLKVTKELNDKVRGLAKGDYVLLSWQHDYVTKVEPGGGSSSFPERIVTKLEKITKEEGEAKLKDAKPEEKK